MVVSLKCFKEEYLYKGEDVTIFNVQINENYELIFNYVFQKKLKSFKCKGKVKLNFLI
jgi:plasmid maintenance system killer protein